MRLFKRKTMKSGYCNISEPISDLDPARMSVIKARHSKKTKQPPKTKVMALESETTTAPTSTNIIKADEKITSSNDDTFITETVTLETSPSNRSNNSKPVALSSMESRTYLSLSDKQPSSLSREEAQGEEDAPNRAQDQDLDIPPPPIMEEEDHHHRHHPSKETLSNRERELELQNLKTPETFFRGKNNRKRISIRMDATSQAPTEHPMAAVTIGEGVDKSREFRVPRTKDLHKDETQSQTSDLDKSFSPQIVSVNSDITDPSYGMPSSRRKRQQQQQQQSWKKFRKLRRYLHNSLNSRGNGNVQSKGPMSFLDMIMDALCSYPEGENGNKS